MPDVGLEVLCRMMEHTGGRGDLGVASASVFMHRSHFLLIFGYRKDCCPILLIFVIAWTHDIGR